MVKVEDFQTTMKIIFFVTINFGSEHETWIVEISNLALFGPGQLTSFYFILMNMDFISQPPSKSTLPYAGLQHMQQCLVNFRSIFAPGFWSKWMVYEKCSTQWRFEYTISQSWVFCLHYKSAATHLGMVSLLNLAT